jgi:hypothetical protein
MRIVLDTTVFENGFNSRSAEVSLLKSFLVREGAELCIPKVVYEEALNRARKRIADANSRIDTLHRLTGGQEGFQKVKPDDALHSYDESLKALLRDLSARILKYPGVGHEELVKRALVPSKPFVESGRGYRDALIWYSLLDLARSETGEVVFVSENSEDWCEGGKEFRLHSSLTKELEGLGSGAASVLIVPNLTEFNRRYTVSSLAVEPERALAKGKPADYLQLLVDGKDLIESYLLVALPDSIRRIGGNLEGGELEILGMSSPFNVQHEPPRTLDSERRLLQFSADYRVMVDMIIRRSETSWWMKRFSFQLRRDWHFDQIRAYVTLPLRASFQMIEKGETTEQFSVASAEIALPDIDGPQVSSMASSSP